VKLKAGYDPCVGLNIARLKTVGALTPLLLAASALASSLPYPATIQQDSTAELNALQNDWADNLVSARQDAGPRDAWRNARGHSWGPRGHRRDPGTSQSDSSAEPSTTSNAGTGDNTGLPSLSAGGPSDFQPPAWLSNYVNPPGGGWENSWENLWGGVGGVGGGPDAQLENHDQNAFRGFHTMLKDAPATFDPPDTVPEPADIVFLVSGLFAAALFYRR
jgi:hypothetical protein